MCAKKITKDTAIKAISASVRGASQRKLIQDYKVSETAARNIARIADCHVGDLNRAVLKDLHDAQGKMAKRLSDEMGDLSVGQLPVSIGIVTDKILILEGAGQHQAPTTQINVQINGESKSKDQVIAGLFGNVKGIEGAANITPRLADGGQE